MTDLENWDIAKETGTVNAYIQLATGGFKIGILGHGSFEIGILGYGYFEIGIFGIPGSLLDTPSRSNLLHIKV